MDCLLYCYHILRVQVLLHRQNRQFESHIRFTNEANFSKNATRISTTSFMGGGKSLRYNRNQFPTTILTYSNFFQEHLPLVLENEPLETKNIM